ncbi:MAG: hypothetical protein P8Y42_19160, partial [Exilibacterium sp.]
MSDRNSRNDSGYKWKSHGCRRQAQKAIKPKDKKGSGKVSKADIAVSKINALYRLERELKDKPPHEKYQMRQKV